MGDRGMFPAGYTVAPRLVRRRRGEAKRKYKGGNLTTLNTVKRLIGKNIEMKYVLTSHNAVLDDAVTMASKEVDPTTVNCLNAVAQGDTQNSRDGIKYIVKRVFVRGVVFDTGGTTALTSPLGGPQVAMVALVWDKKTNNAQLNSEDVFEVVGQEYSCPYADRDQKYLDRFKVWKKIITFPPRPVTSGQAADILFFTPQQKTFIFNIKLKVPVLCTGTSANVTDIQNNSFHMIACCSSNTFPASLTIMYESTVFYQDA